jgi:hypothetical protein
MGKSLVFLMVFILFISCDHGNENDSSGTALSSWEQTKSDAYVEVALTDEFEEASSLSIATLGWEDGLNVSRNGLYLYATYIPADFLSYTLSGSSDPSEIPNYARGPVYDMDFTQNPAGESYEWYHSDILFASRSSTDEDFSSWSTADMKRASYSEGAVSTVFSDADTIEMVAFTSNEDYTNQNNIYVIANTAANPSGTGSALTAVTDGTVNTEYVEDNPHLEKINSNNWVLFFDSEDRPGGLGSHDLWYSTSSDGGMTWTGAANVSSINTVDKEHQPHLYNDGIDWYLYFAQYHSDNKLAIFRSKQGTADDWDSWETPELVLSAGNTAGIGEPTLTDEGDLFFVVITENSEGSSTDRYDGDPWVAWGK